jgi:zinc protease
MFMRSCLHSAVSAFSLIIALPSLATAQTAPIVTENVAVSEAVRKAWGFDQSNIAPDMGYLYGVLPNGMRYAIRKNQTPKHAASVRMRFDIGSTADLQGQEGGAHYLEHMAFNGSKKVPEGEMIKLLERFGLSFGADTNAYTSFTETVYMLELPQVTPQIMDTAMMLMRETASELTISEGAVERERGIILGELRARENFGLRQVRDQLNFFAPGTPITRGLPVGTEASIKATTAKGLRELYESYYTPARATLIIVGDVDPVALEKQIKASFSDWKAKAEKASDPAAGTIDPNRPSSARFFVDPDVPTSISLSAIKPARKGPDTLARRSQEVAEALGSAIISRRLDTLVRSGNAPFTGGSASSNDLISTAHVASISIVAKERDWKSALTVAEQEWRRAMEHGFTKAELDEQIANVRTSLKNAVAQASTRNSNGLAMAVVTALENGRIVSTPADGLARFEQLAPTLTPEKVTAAYRALWGNGPVHAYVAHNQATPDALTQVAQVLDASRKVAVTAPVATADKAFAHTNFGAKGTVAKDSRIKDLDIRTIRFANGVALNIKKTDFEKGRVRVAVRVGGGSLELANAPEGLGLFMSTVFASGGTTEHAADELSRILAGRTVSTGLNAGQDAFSSMASTTPADLQLQMQVMAASITAAGYRPEADAQWRNIVGAFLPTLDSQPGGVASRDVPRILANGDKRFGFPSEAVLKGLTSAQMKDVIDPKLKGGPIEIAIVGDIDEAAAIETVAKTFGALSTRPAKFPLYAEGRNVAFPASRAPITLRHSGKPDQGLAMIVWPTTDDANHRQEVTMELLGQLLQLQATDILREKLGATYSPNASSSMSSLYKGYGQMTVSSTADPAKIDEINAAVDEIAKSLAATAPSADLITRARNPMIERIERNRRENGYWLGIVDEAQSLPKDLRYPREQEKLLRSITAAELQAAAKRWLNPANALRIRIIPKEAKPPS